MTLIVGGVYQGKLEYAMDAFGLGLLDFQDMKKAAAFDFEKAGYNGLDWLVLNLIRRGEDPMAYIKGHLPRLQDKIIIVNDISQGVVPIDPVMRQWREENGRITALLSQEANQVVRLFAGIAEVLR